MKSMNVKGLMGFATLALGLLTATQASAQLANAPVPGRAGGVCKIEASLRITSVHIGIGGSSGEGEGVISCDYADGAVERIPVWITTTMGGVGLGISVKDSQMLATGIGVAGRGGISLTGHYALTKASAEVVVVGAEAGLGFTISREGFSIPAALSFTEGLGLDGAVDTGDMDIEVRTPPRYRY